MNVFLSGRDGTLLVVGWVQTCTDWVYLRK
jgi:hypothetical protein